MSSASFLANMTNSIIKKHFIKYLTNYFNELGIRLPEKILIKVETSVANKINNFLDKQLTKEIKNNFDYITLGKIDLKKVIGLDAALQLIKETLEYTYNLIVVQEPEDTLRDFLKSQTNFIILIELCFRNYIENSILKKFTFLKEFEAEKKELIIDRIIDLILANYNYYKCFDPNKASFKTFLYKDIIFSSISIFRKENLNYFYYKINDDFFKKFISYDKPNINYKNRIDIYNREYFYSKEEAINWIQNVISYETFTHDKNLILSFIEKKKVLQTGFRK